MDLEKESGMLTLIFADDTVQYRDRILPTGSIACMAMNIPKEMLEECTVSICKNAINMVYYPTEILFIAFGEIYLKD